MSEGLAALPGMTRRAPGPADQIHTVLHLGNVSELAKKKVILIATASITDGNIFNNGLYQNCFLLYRLAEAIGWLPILVVNEKPKNLEAVPLILRGCRVALIEEIVNNPVHVSVYLEVGMSMDPSIRRMLRMLGARNAKLYLGNILNIDIETPLFFQGMFFSHHVVGEQSEIWVSPHYKMHSEYASILNGCEAKPESMKIAPYVWEPAFLYDEGRRNFSWTAPQPGTKLQFIIMEPNISFQKNSLVPLFILEKFARDHPNMDFEVLLLNADRLGASGYFHGNIEPHLELSKRKMIKYLGRHDMITVMTAYPSAFAICHHVNNEYNYMVFEFMSASYPVLHNCEAWKEYGYYYPDCDFDQGAKVLEQVLTYHVVNQGIYRSHAEALMWRHSIYNPENQKAWINLLDGKAPTAV